MPTPAINQHVQTGSDQRGRRTKAVNSCGLEISFGAIIVAAAVCFAVPFTLGPEIFGILLGIGEADTFRGEGPIVDTAERKEHEE